VLVGFCMFCMPCTVGPLNACEVEHKVPTLWTLLPSCAALCILCDFLHVQYETADQHPQWIAPLEESSQLSSGC